MSDKNLSYGSFEYYYDFLQEYVNRNGMDSMPEYFIGHMDELLNSDLNEREILDRAKNLMEAYNKVFCVRVSIQGNVNENEAAPS